MEKIERYLDQVCHGIAGPRALRAHIRLELKEHLVEAVARHQGPGFRKRRRWGGRWMTLAGRRCCGRNWRRRMGIV
jgi:hypothetical protein